ncbi:MAG: hypothetical protein QOF48_2429 [Verrucomicrobiota bacterium]|jgi:hypothetical protein
MNILLGNNVRLPLTAEPWVEAPLPVEFSEAPTVTIFVNPPTSADGPVVAKAAGPLPRSAAEHAMEEPFDQFDDLLTPLGSTALSDWPL